MILGVKELAANHLAIKDEDGTFLVSYNSVVCQVQDKPGMGYDYHIRFFKNYDCSRTTLKNIHQFLKEETGWAPEGSKAINQAISSGYADGGNIAVMYDRYYDHINPSRK